MERLGRYTVLKHLASGGMADVLLARTDGIEGFERHVVLKRIRAEHAKDQRFIDMFLDEARLAANLHHQNIGQVHDIGESDGEFFFAMEYIHGEDLRSMLTAVAKTRAHMPLGYVIAIVTAAAAGLHYAHERRDNNKRPLNIVHRDVSPSNILVGYDGSVKLVDFGIAKAAMRQVETRSGSLKGKVSYMSPEQCKMATVDRRSDVYALGVVLYELVTSTRLFKSDSDYLVMDAICTGKIPAPRVRRPDLPDELSSIIMRALETDADRRYQTAEELRTALDQFAIKEGLTASTGTIASYVHKLFGERPEPWLETAAAGDGSPGFADTLAGATSDLSRKSWTELPATAAGDDAKTTTDGKGRTKPAQVAAEPAAERTGSKLGWEQSGKLPDAPVRTWRAGKLAIVALPVIAIAGFAIWKFGFAATDEAGAKPAVAALDPAAGSGAPTPPAPDPSTVEPTTVEPSTVEPTTVEPVAAPVNERTVPRRPPAPAPGKDTPIRDRIAPPRDAVIRPAPTTNPVAKPTPPDAAAKAPAKPSVPADAGSAAKPAVAVAPAITPPPAQPPPLGQLPVAVVDRVALAHRKQLAGCEGFDPLKGDVSVRFEVDATGRVVKSQVSSTLGKPKVSSCILRAVQGWRFPAGGAAKGTYAASFQ